MLHVLINYKTWKSKTKTSFNLANGNANDTFCNAQQQACLFWSAKITKTCPVSVFDDPLALIN